MRLTGYDAAQGKITDASGAEMVFDTSPRPSPRSRRRGRRNAGEVAAAWAFSGLLAHTLRWTTVAQTHAGGVCAVHAARCITTPASSWRCLRTSTATTEKPAAKKRSQFRVASKNIAALYETVEVVEL